MTKYKLLKDLPDVKAGAIFEKLKDTIYYIFRNISYCEDVIENNPDWFAPYLFTAEDGADVFKGDEFWSVYVSSDNHDKIIQHLADMYMIHTRPSEKLFSTKEKVQEYLDSLKPKFKVGDIVKSFEKGFVFKVKSLLDSYLVVDKEPDNTTPDIVKAEICRLATEQEIIKYYEQQGWVKGAKFKCGGDIDKVHSLCFLYQEIAVQFESTREIKQLRCCELIKESIYPKSWEELPYRVPCFTAYVDDKWNIRLSQQKTVMSKFAKLSYATEEQYNSGMAFIQLTQLHKAMIDEYNRVNGCDWKPDWNDYKQEKRHITRKTDKLLVVCASTEFVPLVFPEKSMAEFSLEFHKELWKQYFEL